MTILFLIQPRHNRLNINIYKLHKLFIICILNCNCIDIVTCYSYSMSYINYLAYREVIAQGGYMRIAQVVIGYGIAQGGVLQVLSNCIGLRLHIIICIGYKCAQHAQLHIIGQTWFYFLGADTVRTQVNTFRFRFSLDCTFRNTQNLQLWVFNFSSL